MLRSSLASVIVLALFVFAKAAPVHAQGLRLAPKNLEPVDRYESVLKRYVKPTGVDYEGLHGSETARRDLQTYVDALAKMPESAQLADWLNAYNALVLSSIVSRWPLNSVMDVKGFFNEVTHQVAGKARTLDEIENGIIRPRFKDARVHFALNCGAKSCPSLHPLAFRPASLGPTLNKLTKEALSDERHVRLTDQGLELSAIFFWFKADFERAEGSVLGFVKKHAKPELAQRIGKDTKLIERSYDWAVNRAR